MFSIIMPSYLGSYRGAASNRREKLIRAIESVRAQTIDSWELIICADGCRETYDLVCRNYATDFAIECVLIAKRPYLDPEIRNFPLTYAKGEWVVYLDSDDYYGPQHLETILNAGIIHNQSEDWFFFNDWIPVNGKWVQRNCQQAFGKCGTSNIAHRRGLSVKWTSDRYGHDDWRFIQDLKANYKNNTTITAGQYYVCHMPGRFDV